MKAGTSWLYLQLRDHPQIATTPLKEIHYFAQHHTDYKLIGFFDRLKRIKEETSLLQADHPDEARASLDWFRAYLADPTDDAWFAGLYDGPLGTKWCAEFCNLMCCSHEQDGNTCAMWQNGFVLSILHVTRLNVYGAIRAFISPSLVRSLSSLNGKKWISGDF
jgi:hypothetical protein